MDHLILEKLFDICLGGFGHPFLLWGFMEIKEPKNEILCDVVLGYRLLPVIKFSGEIYVPIIGESYAGDNPIIQEIIDNYNNDMNQLFTLLKKYKTN